MKHLLGGMVLTVALTLPYQGAAAQGQRLAVTVEPRFGGEPLAFDALTNRIASGQVISVTRLDFLLSHIALHQADGGWLGLTDWSAFLCLREGRRGFELKNLPAGHYDRLRFCVGVPPEVNHRDPANYPAAHPLNPNVNGLHWNWQGGYVFLALEGDWRRADGRPSGYSYHVATDRQLMSVELPMALDLTSDRELRLALDVEHIFSQPHRIALTVATATTHSRDQDALADQLRRNIERAFTVDRVAAAAPVAFASHGSKVELAPNATPYPLTISRFFPRPALPMDNPLTEEGVALGRRLFFDPQLSVNNSQSCASCHDPGAAFTDGKTVSIGAEGKAGTRNAMPLFNLAWKPSFFWDGRAASLREQVLQPIQNPVEMHETLSNVVAKLRTEVRSQRSEVSSRGEAAGTATEDDYPALFDHAFGTSAITSDRIARALEQFLLAQVSHDSKFDRSLQGQAELTEEEKRGFQLFHTEYDPRRRQFGADCFHCHGGPLFQSQSFANNGLEAEPRDLGRFLATGRPGDKGQFAVPSLRNVAVTAPYMHDGRLATLEEVVEHYSTGMKRSPTLDPNLAKHPGHGVPLSNADQKALVAFLKALTDEQFVD